MARISPKSGETSPKMKKKHEMRASLRGQELCSSKGRGEENGGRKEQKRGSGAGEQAQDFVDKPPARAPAGRASAAAA